MKNGLDEREPHPLLEYCQPSSPFSELICPICWELLAGNICITCCGHLFHADCLQRWFQCSKTCPQCRVPCHIFHRIVPLGVRLNATDKGDAKAAPNVSGSPHSETFWMVMAFFVFVLCCRRTKKYFDTH
uniref:RING-type domain-containing protein n=1 Tax=Anopheles funestus TaxID=62324 RepID=A0A182RW08_ANOFN